ncbi:MAG TPA: adenylate/guanylate cyclase domain-containing protein [Aeromicrobium sp.]|nr:adenylate/guanylate cyclase domain-containing protein [Aeromicrobium sp.]
MTKVLSLISIPPWVAMPFWLWAWTGRPPAGEVWLLTLVFSPVTLASSLVVYHWKALHRVAVPLVIVGLLVLHAYGGWLAVATGSLWTVLLSTMLFIYCAPILRLPPLPTAFAAVGMTLSAMWLFLSWEGQKAVAAEQSGPAGVVLLGGLLVVSTLSFFTERSLRRQFASDRVIADQSARLAESQRLIRKYVPAAVAGSIESGTAEAIGAPRRLRVTAFSSDVAGFTQLADRLDPESLSQIINEYVASMTRIIEGSGGVVTEFAGDGLMAVFGAPNESHPEQQVASAVSAAGLMHGELERLNGGWFRLGVEEPLKVRIGINTGVLSVGTFGSEGRATYTAIGLQMNVAARIQAEAEPGTTLLSSTSWHLVKDSVRAEPLGQVMVKGVHYPISVYRPI